MHVLHGFLSLFLIALLALSQTSCSNDAQSKAPEAPEEEAAVPVEVARVEVGEASAYFTGTASLEAEDEALVVAKTGGVVKQTLVEEGAYVEAGQPLAQLDDERLALELVRAEANFSKLQRVYDRSKDLYDKNLISTEEFERTTSEYETQQAARDLARLEHAYTTVRAPISGFVSERLIKPGNMVRTNDPTFRVTDFLPLRAVMHVPERETGKLRISQPAELRFDALPGEVFSGRVKLISPVVDPGTGTFKVTIEVADPSRRVKPGMFSRVNVLYDTRSSTLMVPKEAVIAEDDESAVFVVRDSMAFRQVVQTGYTHGDRIEILSGTLEGDTVITTGQNNLRDSTKVEVIN